MNDKLNEIINNLKSQNDNSAELVNALETLDNILSKFYDLQVDIIDTDKRLSIESVIASIDRFNLKYSESLNTISNLSYEINKLTQSFDDRSNAQINNFKKQSDDIDKVIQTYDIISQKSNDLGRICIKVNNEINKIDASLTNKLEGDVESLISKSENILNKINYINSDIDRKMDILDKKINKFEELNNNISEKVQSIEGLLKEIKKESTLGDIKDKIEDVMILAEYINDAVEKQSIKNQNEVNGFEYLANKWAEENIHSLALRKRK